MVLGYNSYVAWVHRMTKLDLETRTGICAHCGPVRLARRKNGWRCWEGVREQRWGKQGRPLRPGVRSKVRDEMVISQQGLCAICRDPLIEANLDHDHTTGRIRAVLCRSCNLALGHLKDDASLADRAADYLRSYA